MIKTHVTIDFYGANPQSFEKTELLKEAIDSALDSLNLRSKQDSYIQFEPIGVTATVVGDHFHFSIHTWPEHQSCAIDLYSSQDQVFAREIAAALKESFQASEYDIKFLNRTMKTR